VNTCEQRVKKIERKILKCFENMAPTENKAGERKSAVVSRFFISQRTATPTVKGFVRL